MPDKGDLKVREYEYFKAHYCGVCRAIGTRCSQAARMALSYDATFLALLLSAMSPGKTSMKRCLIKGGKKIPVIQQHPAIDFAADMNVLLAYHKCEDDIQDEKRLTAFVGKALLWRASRKVVRKYPGVEAHMHQCLKWQQVVERSQIQYVDEAAEPFVELMAGIMAYAPDIDKYGREDILLITRNAARWIYWIDALDDLEIDLKKGRYNPLLVIHKQSEPESAAELLQRITSDAERSLTYMMAEMAACFERLNPEYRPIIENYIYLGMRSVVRKVLKGDKCCEESL